MRTISRLKVLNLARDGWDHGDPFGSAMLAWFDIAEIMTFEGMEVPREWEYRPSPIAAVAIETWLASELMGRIDGGEITENDLAKAGNVLARFVAFTRRSGRAY